MYRFKHLFLLAAVIAVLAVFTNEMYCDGLIWGGGQGSDTSGIEAAFDIYRQNMEKQGYDMGFGTNNSAESSMPKENKPVDMAKPSAPKHEHSYAAEPTKEATCAEEGIIMLRPSQLDM